MYLRWRDHRAARVRHDFSPRPGTPHLSQKSHSVFVQKWLTKAKVFNQLEVRKLRNDVQHGRKREQLVCPRLA
jgi:hypothetical protein